MRIIGLRRPLFLLFSIFFLYCPYSSAEIEFSSRDRILVLAPHPDDEALTVLGPIQRALKAKARLKIVYFTNGDYNELSYFLYKRTPVFTKGGFIKIGKSRQAESRAAMQYLGIKNNDLVFLGYPDRFTEAILTSFWNPKKPPASLITQIKRVPYEDAPSFGAPYVGQSILKDLKRILIAFNPTKIFVSSPQDTNPDHRSLYVYLKIALLDLEKELNPKVYTYLVHKPGWPQIRGYRPDSALDKPLGFDNKIVCENISFTPEEIQKKYNVITLYKSQLSFAKHYFLSFVRKNELFCVYPQIDLVKEALANYCETDSKIISAINYSRDKKFFYMHIAFNRKIAANIKANIYLLGYKKDLDFSFLPKIFLKVKGSYKIAYNKRKMISTEAVVVSLDSANMFIRFPLAKLNYPDYIFSRIILKGKIFALHIAPWVLLKM
jgi:LmbE family N-acetylglucosaminyl deacetylase